MSRPKSRRTKIRAGVFLGPDLLAAVPLVTLSDAYHDSPTEPADSDLKPEPEAPGLIRRVLDRLSLPNSR